MENKSDNNHCSFKQKHTFVCSCGAVWAGHQDKAVCQTCKKHVHAQPAGRRGGNVKLHGLYCCPDCGYHFSVAGAREDAVEPVMCTRFCTGVASLHIIAPINICHPWIKDSRICQEKKEFEREARMRKAGRQCAEETYGKMTDDEMLRRLGEWENQIFIKTTYDVGVYDFVADRLGCDFAMAEKIIKSEAARVKQREEAANYEKEKNMRECSFCGNTKPKEQVLETNCTYQGREDHLAWWCGACRKKEQNFFKHQKEGWHSWTKTCDECGHIRHYGCKECKGLSFTFREWDTTTEVYASRNTPSFLIEAASAAASAASAAYRCGFCHELADDELILKKRCKSCRRPHMCCNRCMSATSCAQA